MPKCLNAHAPSQETYLLQGSPAFSSYLLHTDKKENKIFLIYKEIQSGAVAKSYRRKGFLIYEEMRKYFPIYEEQRRPLVTYDFATAPF
jgi:hypothetical protein